MLFPITRTKLRIIYWGSFILFMVLVVLPLFFFFYLFNENKVKQTIINQFNNKNYNVAIYGGIVPKLWHGMSLDLSGVVITAKNSDELVKIRRMSCKLSWLDLIIGRYKVNRIAIDGVSIDQKNVLHYGLVNLLNISNRSDDLFNIEKLEVSDIDSSGKNVVYPVTAGSLTIAQNGLGLEFNLGFKSIKDNTYYMISGNSNAIDSNNINFDSFNMHIYNMHTNVNISSKADYSIIAKTLSLTDVVSSLQIKNYAGVLNINNVVLGLDKAVANGASLKIDFTNNLITHNILLNAENIITYGYHNLQIDKLQSQYKANITNYNFVIDSKIESLVYFESKGIFSNVCSNQMKFSTSTTNTKNEQLNAILDGKCAYDTYSKAFTFGLVGSLNNAPVQLDLQIFNNKDKPYIIAYGNIDALDLSKISFIDNKSTPLFSDTSKLPFDWLSLLNAKANLSIQHFVLDRIVLDNLTTEFNIYDNQLNIRKLDADVYHGRINGNLKINKNGDKYNIYAKQAINSLSLKDMLSSYFDIKAISGTANMVLDASAEGVRNYDEIHKKISGEVSIEAKEGAFQGVDFNLFVNPESIGISTNRSTIFNHMKANFKFNNGLSNNGWLEFSSPYVIANGVGTLNFINNTLNYNLNIKSALPKNKQKISLVVIPVTVNGDIAKPKINIQNIRLIGDKNMPGKTSSLKHKTDSNGSKHRNK